MPENTKILVVDDNPAALYATSRILRSAGYSVLQANNGSAALKAAASADLVVLDINLPDIDGFEVCRQLRSERETEKLPIVHLSATFIQNEDFEIGLAAGADSYLTRPVEPLVLLATVRTLLFARQADIVRRDLNATFRTMFNLSPTAIAILDSSLNYQSVNPAYTTLMGICSDDLLRRIENRQDGFRSDALLASIRNEIASHDSRSGDLVINRPDGSTADVSWEATKEDVSGVTIVLARDVTAQRVAEREREQLLASERAARADAERSNRLKEEFLAMLSHELRNPLNAIVGWAAVLSTITNLPTSVNAAVQAIHRNAHLQAQMIADLLEYAGISFGKIRLQLAVFDPYSIIQNAIDMLAPAAKQKNVSVHMHKTANAAPISGDAGRFQQIVTNLVGNAIKFSADGGTVQVDANSSEKEFSLAVHDEGLGISSEFLPHIFERFSQQDTSTTRNHGGLGLGLAIVKHLVELHGGTISASSAGEGRGATFNIRLPARHGMQDNPYISLIGPSSEDVRGMVVLVVEDDVDSRELIARILTDAGAKVIEAASGDAAMLAVEGNLINLLISDIGMAGQDGYQLLRQLRQRGYDATRLPAIAVTAFAGTKDRESAVAAGFQHHLTKPVDSHMLLRVVATFKAAP